MLNAHNIVIIEHGDGTLGLIVDGARMIERDTPRTVVQEVEKYVEAAEGTREAYTVALRDAKGEEGEISVRSQCECCDTLLCHALSQHESERYWLGTKIADSYLIGALYMAEA